MSALPRCRSDACNQGRKPCPTPLVCEVPCENRVLAPRDAIGLVLIFLVSAVLSVGFIALVVREVVALFSE